MITQAQRKLDARRRFNLRNPGRRKGSYKITLLQGERDRKARELRKARGCALPDGYQVEPEPVHDEYCEENGCEECERQRQDDYDAAADDAADAKYEQMKDGDA